METKVWKDETGNIWLEEPHKPYPWIKVSGDRREVRRSTKEMLAHHKLIEMVPKTPEQQLHEILDEANALVDEFDPPPAEGMRSFWKGILVTLPPGVELNHIAVGVVELTIGKYKYTRDDEEMVWRKADGHQYRISPSVLERRMKELTGQEELDWQLLAYLRCLPYADEADVRAGENGEPPAAS